MIDLLLKKAARMPGFAKAAWMLRATHLGVLVHAEGDVLVRGGRGIHVGDRAFFVGGPIAGELLCGEGAELFIGAGTGLNYGFSIRASRSVRIGPRSSIGAMVRIRDDDGFRVAPVNIGANVWIAHGAIIEPGVSIGDGAVVAAGSVVMSDVPAGTMAMGNPARCLPLALGQKAASGAG